MKKAILTTLAIASFTAFGYSTYSTWTDPETELTWRYVLNDDGTASVGTGDSRYPAVLATTVGDITIPTAVGNDKCPVVGITEDAFYDCTKLTNITIPSCVTNIGQGAFYDCYGLTNAVIPSSVRQVGTYAFGVCKKLKRVKIEAELTEISDYMFENCYKLESISLPSTVTNIGFRAFASCEIKEATLPGIKLGNELNLSYVTNLNMSAGVTTVEDNVFKGLKKLRHFTLPASVTTIGSQSFANCTGLESLTLPSTVTNVGAYAFQGCTGLKSVSITGSGTTQVGEYAFDGCSALTSVTISGGDKSIGTYAFNKCTELTTLTLGEGVRSLGKYAFYHCDKITHVTVPAGLEEYDYAFYGCYGIKDVTIMEGVKSIGDSAFCECGSITNVTFSSSVTTIGDDAFSGCPLTSLILPEGVQTICGGAFMYGCFESLTIPSSTTNIEEMAFWCCCNLKSVVVENGVKVLPAFAFYECTAIESVSLPASITTAWFDQNATIKNATVPGKNFGISSLWTITNLVISEGTTAIEKSAFSNFRHLKSVTIPSSVKTIGDSAFYGCDAMTELNIASGVRTIGQYAFRDCKALEELTLQEGLTKLGEGSFFECTSLRRVSLPASLTTIGRDCFEESGRIEEFTVASGNNYFKAVDGMLLNKAGTELIRGVNRESITVPSGVMFINSYAFNQYGAIRRVTIPASVSELGEGVFGGCGELEEFVVNSNNKSFKAIDGSLTTINGKELIRCAKEKWTLPETVTTIGSCAFQGLQTLTSITIPSNITSIGYCAFYACSNLESVVFAGNAPSVAYFGFGFNHSNCTAYVSRDSKGWGVTIPGKWKEIKIAYASDPSDAIPDLGENATAAQVEAALVDSADPKLATAITNAANYNAYREWAAKVKASDGGETAGAQAVKESPTAWLSFALDSDTLLDESQTNATVTVESFEPTANAGEYAFAVSVADVEIGSKASEENLKRVFGIEGGRSLDGMTSDQVRLNFSTPTNGMARFTAGPTNATESTFFMRVNMTP